MGSRVMGGRVFSRVVLVLVLSFLFFLGGVRSGSSFSFCLPSFFNKEKTKPKNYEIEYSKPVFLDVENLYRNRTIFVVLINFNVKEGLEENVKKCLFEEFKKVGMEVVSDPKRGAYMMGLFLRKIDKDEIVVDVLIRERPEVKGFEGKTKFYSSDLDSVDHLTTIKVKRKDGDKEEEVLEGLVRNLVNLFKKV
jgi:hypothetical protein